MRIIFIGDIVGTIGRKLVKTILPGLVDKEKVDFAVANGENAAGGFGITESTARELFDCGIHVLTTGNHVWDKKEAVGYLAQNDRVLRPLNYPPGVPGFGSVIYYLGNGLRVGVINLSGRVFMPPMDCPFRSVLPEIERIKKETNIIIVDFHGEATSEKIALGYYLDGKVSAVVGTHTHVQTADERVLPAGTAFITDTGMTGPLDSIIGIKVDQILEKFLTGMPLRYEVAKGPGVLCGVVIDIDNNSGGALSIERIQIGMD